MPKGNAPAPAQNKKGADSNDTRPNGKRWKAAHKGDVVQYQKAAAAENAHNAGLGIPSPWEQAKAARAERRKHLTRKVAPKAEPVKADKVDKSSPSQARRNGSAGDNRKDKTPQPISAV